MADQREPKEATMDRISLPTWQVRNMLEVSVETLQHLLHDPIDQMSLDDATARQQTVARLLEQAGLMYIELIEANDLLPEAWDAPTLSNLVHEVETYLAHPTGFDWEAQEYVYVFNYIWQELKMLHTSPAPTTPVPSA